MAFPKVKLSDDSGNTVAVDTSGSSNALKVSLLATPTIDIGDVSLLLGGTAASTNADTMDDQTLRVTLATDDTHFGDVGAAASSTGGVHAQLRTIVNSLSSQPSMSTNLSSIAQYIVALYQGSGAEFEAGDGGSPALVVRNDTLTNLDASVANGDFSMLQVNAEGALYTTGNTLHGGTLPGENFTVMGESKVIDGSALPNTVPEGRNARLAMSRAGIAYSCLTDDVGASDLGTTAVGHLSEIEGAVETIEGAVDSGQMQVDVVASLPGGDNNIGNVDIVSAPTLTVQVSDTSFAVADGSALGEGVLVQGDDGSDRKNIHVDASTGDVQVDVTNTVTVDGSGVTQPVSLASVPSHAVTNAGTFAVQAGHDITGLASDDNDTVGISAEKISGADGDVACKRIDIMAHPDNTGYIWIGDSAVSVDGYNGGIRLSPGDFYSMDIDNTGDVYAIATVNGENVCFNYFT